jgi:hypothetical protein
MKKMIWIGMIRQIPNLKLEDVEKMNEGIKGEVIDMFGAGWAIIGDKQAQDNFGLIAEHAKSYEKSDFFKKPVL